MRVFTLFLLAAGIAILAGCVANDDGTPDGGDNNDTNSSADNGTTTSVSMDFPAAGPGPLGPSGGSFEVPANTTSIIVEARWTCTSPTCDIAISVVDPDGAEAGSGSGSGSADFVITNPAAGTYTVEFSTSAPVAGVAGEARITTFMAAVPDGFTAWTEEEA